MTLPAPPSEPDSTSPAGQRPISFVCVRRSPDFVDRALTSFCIHDPLNELIVVDNRFGVFHPNLTQAMNIGIARARHDLIILLDESVRLPRGWQAMFEASLETLEAIDPGWGVLGIGGWDADDRFYGWPAEASDDERPRSAYWPVEEITGDVIILRKSSGLIGDPELPGVEGIGIDLPQEAARRGLASYVIYAPLGTSSADATPIADGFRGPSVQATPATSGERACVAEYLYGKWDEKSDFATSVDQFFSLEQRAVVEAPLILLGRGGSGSRLLSLMAGDLGIFLGSQLNESGDSLEMVEAVYRGVMRKFHCPSRWQQSLTVPQLKAAAALMLAAAAWPRDWGFKLPECLLILPELRAAFPRARYVALKRDPLTAVLRRPHKTARLDNQVGRATVPAAYDFLGLPRQQILRDDDTLRMAVTSAHQLWLLLQFRRTCATERWLELRFEDVLSAPHAELKRLARFCGLMPKSERILAAVDVDRPRRTAIRPSDHVLSRISELFSPLRRALGYVEVGSEAA